MLDVESVVPPDVIPADIVPCPVAVTEPSDSVWLGENIKYPAAYVFKSLGVDEYIPDGVVCAVPCILYVPVCETVTEGDEVISCDTVDVGETIGTLYLVVVPACAVGVTVILDVLCVAFAAETAVVELCATIAPAELVYVTDVLEASAVAVTVPFVVASPVA